MRYPSFQEYMRHEYKGPWCATDAIVRYCGGIVLIERNEQPYGIALPGGMAERMTFGENAVKETREETGLQLILDYAHRPFQVDSDVERDPRAFIAACTFTGKGYGTLCPQKNEDAKRAFVVPMGDLSIALDRLPWAVQGHREVLGNYLLAYSAGSFQDFGSPALPPERTP